MKEREQITTREKSWTPEKVNAMINPELRNLEETRILLGGVSRPTIYRLLNLKQLNGKKINRRTMITQKSIDEYIKNLEDYQGAPNGF